MASRKTGITFEPIHRESTREKVHGAIRGAILDGRLQLGQRLTEISLAKDFGVSRAVVREALQQLAHDGLVEQNAYRGSSVVFLTPGQVDEIISTRVLLEAEAVRLAVKRITAADLAYLEKLTRQIHDAHTDPDATSELDLAFHEKLWEVSGNGTLQKILLQITAPLFAMGAIMRHAERTNRTQARKSIRRSSHSVLMDHIKSRDANKAAVAIREHIEANWTLIRSHLEEYLEAEAKSSAKTARQKS
jgi:DNA-binding GntR family transcriptional regulator